MIQIDTERHKVFSNGREFRFSPREFSVIKLLAESDGKVVSREQILDGVYGQGGNVYGRTVDQHVARIRRALGKTAIRTVTGAGYSGEGLQLASKKKYGAIESINGGFILVRVDSVDGLKVGGAVRVA